MGLAVCHSALCKCSFGAAPSPLTVLPISGGNVMGLPMATVMDHIPMLNIKPFGMCISMQNPMVIAATSAALGVLTPMPCIPATVAPWTPTQAKLKLMTGPALGSDSKLKCMWGGSISVAFPGQPMVTIG
ncbi:MAG: DUF4280 domain-containing protein [Alphaproteobacteria bacterium]